jgi:uracil-DNA glycosylase
MPDQPPKPTRLSLIRDELAALTTLLRAHVQAQVDLGLDACAPPPDAWVGWQRSALDADDILWDGYTPKPSAQPPARGLPPVTDDLLRPLKPPAPAPTATTATTAASAVPRAAAQGRSQPPPARPAPSLPAASPSPAKAASPFLVASDQFKEALLLSSRSSVLDSPEPPSLDAIRADARACSRCAFCRSRTQAVVGEGNPNAKLLIVTAPPNALEDRLGKPLVGPAGDLFDNILKAMTLTRDQVYITPVIKCRAPDDDSPASKDLTTAIATCEPFLTREQDSVRPLVILALGSVAAQSLLRLKTPITVLRGQWHSFRGMDVMPTLHPINLLQRPEAKPLVWRDLQLVMQRLGIQRP